MRRSMFGMYVDDAQAAIELYQEAFGATVLEIVKAESGLIYHSELDVFGQIIAVSDRGNYNNDPSVGGNTMQFCLHFAVGEEALVHKAYDLLRQGGTVGYPLGPADYCDCTCDVTDRFGVRWCVFTA